MVRSADCKAFSGKFAAPLRSLILYFSLENRHQEVAFLDVVDIQTVHPGVVAAFGQQRDAVIERQIEGRGHAQNDERRGFALVLVRPREPFRVGFDDARDPEIDDAGVDVRSLAPLRSSPRPEGPFRSSGQYHRHRGSSPSMRPRTWKFHAVRGLAGTLPSPAGRGDGGEGLKSRLLPVRRVMRLLPSPQTPLPVGEGLPLPAACIVPAAEAHL